MRVLQVKWNAYQHKFHVKAAGWSELGKDANPVCADAFDSGPWHVVLTVSDEYGAR